MVDLNLPKQRKMKADAAVWKRIVSFLIDFFIIQLIILGPFSSAMQGMIPVTDDFMQNYNMIQNNPDIVTNLIPMIAAIIILVYSYFVVFEFKLRQTPGKMFFNLELKANDKKLTLGKIFLRNLAVIPVFPFSLLWIIDPLYLIITGKRLSDNFSKTSYVEEINR